MIMHWGSKGKPKSNGQRDKYASAPDIDMEFELRTEQLHWLAEVITGDPKLADQCVIDGRSLANRNSGVFRDWLGQWARSATIRSSVDCVRTEIAASEVKYEQARCVHSGHGAFSVEKADAIQTLPPEVLVSTLDPFARAVMVLRGVQRAAIQECALTLRSTRAAVNTAFCSAERAISSCEESEYRDAAERSLTSKATQSCCPA